ncbi:MAG: hypothetical protein J6R05_00440 [Bacteroidaceae bacterium]|jgi:hypothetical protein|nr:hypothetical protein [Bacteroidaceae bacterium]
MTAQVQKDFLVNHIVDKLTEYLVTDNSLELADALKMVYQSKTYQQLQDTDGDLYIQSASYVYELLLKELKR